MRARKRFGQHFLQHRAILDRIVAALAPAPGDLVLEIGPGPGGLTEALAARGARVVAIEKDRDLVPLAQGRVPEARIVEGDALALDWRAIAAAGPDQPLLVTGNIPYNITSPLLDRALLPPRPARIVFLVQKEVAERLAAAPGGKTYGALTVGVQAVAGVEKLFTVPAGAFTPPPKVESAVVRIVPLADPMVEDADLAAFRRLVVGLFGFRRKQLVRGLRELTGWPAERVVLALERAGLAVSARPETVEPRAFAGLLRVLIDGGWRPD
ncbi:MAG TPA: 16S rRNA (adenine(1518)-N(6)/adenine(1519)-N(6))-dimethyltransferase RsmA [Gemmatimonadales bacterium]|nr:16S rRNA (adenine(1518)-N(6)/adenine(1519)-N(6))-dimethyltransferase RsmA [Gemmatimonadales bacterium]